MRVKCIDDSKGVWSGRQFLVCGQVYEVRSAREYAYYLVDDPKQSNWMASRFVVVPDNACPQCGEIH